MPAMDVFNPARLEGRGPINIDRIAGMIPQGQDLIGNFRRLGYSDQAISDLIQANGFGAPVAAARGQLDDLRGQLSDIRGQVAGTALEPRVAALEAIVRQFSGDGMAQIGILGQEVAHLKAVIAGLGQGGYGRSYAQGEPRSVTDTWVNGDTTSVYDFGTVSFPSGFDAELTSVNEINSGLLTTIADITVAGKSMAFLNGTGTNAFRSTAAGRQVVTFPQPAVGQVVITLNVIAPSAGTCQGTLTLWSRGESGSGRQGLDN